MEQQAEPAETDDFSVQTIPPNYQLAFTVTVGLISFLVIIFISNIATKRNTNIKDDFCTDDTGNKSCLSNENDISRSGIVTPPRVTKSSPNNIFSLNNNVHMKPSLDPSDVSSSSELKSGKNIPVSPHKSSLNSSIKSENVQTPPRVLRSSPNRKSSQSAQVKEEMELGTVLSPVGTRRSARLARKTN